MCLAQSPRTQARRRFAQSLAGYSVVAYLLRFKDRHNGNVMITSEGRLIHIDFGFVFGQAPGNKVS
jgi:phosphatidylinositol kinase/protein kinase (PI-3  family)